MGLQNIFGEDVLNVGALLFPSQYFTVKVIGMEMGGQYVQFTRPLQEIIMHDSPVVFRFGRIFVVIDDNGYTFHFDGETAVINIIQCHKLTIL